MKIIRKDIIPYSPLRKALGAFVILLLSALLLFLYRMPDLLFDRARADYYCKNLFGYVSFFGNMVSNMLLFSITENIVIVGGLTLIVLFFILLYMTIKRLVSGGTGKTGRNIFKLSVVILLILNILMADYQLMHGINYRRTPIAHELGIDTGSQRSYEEYCEALKWAYAGMIEARSQLGEDYNGVAHMKTNFGGAVYDANIVMDQVSDRYGLGLSRNYINAKPVSLSRYWSYTGITGFYDMLIGEANVNTDYLDITGIPLTICHEISHAKGYARESDATVCAILTCIHSSRPDFRYAGFLRIFLELYSITTEYAQFSGQELPTYINQDLILAIDRDMQAAREYEAGLADNFYTRMIERFSNKANDAFLKANGQKDGVRSYEIRSSIFIEFYFDYVKESSDDQGRP